MRCVISDAIEKVFVSFFYYLGYRGFVSVFSYSCYRSCTDFLLDVGMATLTLVYMSLSGMAADCQLVSGTAFQLICGKLTLAFNDLSSF